MMGLICNFKGVKLLLIKNVDMVILIENWNVFTKEELLGILGAPKMKLVVG